MKQAIVRALFSTCCAILLGSPAQAQDALAKLLASHQQDLHGAGTELLAAEANYARFFVIGSLHGDNETSSLVQALSASAGFRYSLTELSPWMAAAVGASNPEAGKFLRGGDIEASQLHIMIQQLAKRNEASGPVQQMRELSKDGYKRERASELLALLGQATSIEDIPMGGVSLARQIEATLSHDAARVDPGRVHEARVRREQFMKELFLVHYREASAQTPGPVRLIAVFGRNHMFRGRDRRGISTLGNFIAEFAVAEGTSSFHLAIFAAGGEVNFGGVRDADEREGDPAFGQLAAAAKYNDTLFDLRPIRAALRQQRTDQLTPDEEALLYWADGYDAILVYSKVTPFGAQ